MVIDDLIERLERAGQLVRCPEKGRWYVAIGSVSLEELNALRQIAQEELKGIGSRIN